MFLTIRSSLLLFFVSLAIYGCGSAQRTVTQPTIGPNLPVSTTTFAASSSKNNIPLKGVVLVKNTDKQLYYLSNLGDSETTPLDIPINNRGIALSPNGKMIVYIPNTSRDLYLLDINTMTSAPLLNSNNYWTGIGLAWSKDNQSIVFSCGVQGTMGLSLCLVNIKNPKNVQVLIKSEIFGATNILDGVFSPSWSNDESKIAFLAVRSLPSSGGKSIPRRDIWLFDISTQSAQKIFSDQTDGISYIFNPIFLPSDNSILFSGRKEQFNTLYKYEISSQQVKDIVLLNTNNNTDIVDFVLSPDAKSLLIHSPLQGDSAQDIPTLFFLDGRFQEQLNSLAGFQVISWSAQ